EIFGKENFYIELQHHPESEDQQKANPVLRELAKEFSLPLVVTTDSHYPKLEDRDAHDVLLAVQTGSQIDEAERLSLKAADLSIKTPEEIEKAFRDLPEALENTWKLAERCNVQFEFDKLVFPKFQTATNEDSISYLRKLAYENFAKFYAETDQEAKERLEYELGVIEKTGFGDYFLIVQDFIRFAKEKGILTNTRGSAAGSLVSYVLGITAIDPIKYNLIFERFLNPERVAPPDIDLDVADDKREEVIEYIREKYGRDHVAQIITFGVMKARLAVRDVTRALGLPYNLGDRISKLIPFNHTIEQTLEMSKELKDLYDTNPDAKTVMDMARRLEGVVRHASTHAAGIVITPEPSVNYLPLQQATRNSTEIITQYTMYDIEKIGLLKMDVLGLANLTIIKNTLRIIRKLYEKDIDLDGLGFEDQKVFQLLSRGDTVGVFQLEGSGMTHYLKELKPSRFEDIIVMISLYRPGALDAGMVPEYILRKHGKKEIKYLDPRLEPILKETYGIIVYQEQLMKIAQVAAGFSLPEADTLRKAVGKKIKKLLEEQKEKFISGALKNGLEKVKAEKLWEWFEPFARYGFNKGHAASYARISYQTAWLKAHYTKEFMAALLTSDFGNLDRIAIEISECERLGIKIIPPDVNRSFVEFGVTRDTGEITFSLAAIKGVGVGVAEAIQNERKENGVYSSLTNFVERVPRYVVNKKTLEALIKTGALDTFAERNQMLVGLDAILQFANQAEKEKSSVQAGLFAGTPGNGRVLKLPQVEPASREQRLAWERELLGMYLSDHPLNGMEARFARAVTPIFKIISSPNGNKVRIGGIISVLQRIMTKTGRPMLFSMIEDRSAKIEVVVFPNLLEQNPLVWQKDRVVVIEGRLDNRNGS
ncbi:MAG: DNA polymerase III subunit alpha, partial [Parcubacteria group bacterium]|nr:DNA polymerase III subunit alpha [Parcubacteria group bacterium]